MHPWSHLLRLLTANDVDISGDDTVFRHSSRRSFITMVVLVAGMVGVFVAGYRDAIPDVVAVVAGGTMLLLSLPSRFIHRRAMSPGNWQLAWDRRRVLVNVRSYLNPGFPRDIPHVVELQWDEIAAARPAALDVRGQDASHAVQRHTLHFLDLEVDAGTDLAELRTVLDRERTLRAKGQAWRHYPVSIVDDRVLRIEWRTSFAHVVPGLGDAITLLPERTPVREETRGMVDLGGVGRSLDPGEARRQVRMLAEQGNVMHATLLAKRAFGLSTTDARAYVEGLVGGGGGAS